MESPFDSIPGHRAYGEGSCRKRILIAFNYVPAESARYDPHQLDESMSVKCAQHTSDYGVATTKLGQ